MQTRHLRAALCFALLVLSLHLVAAWLADAYPETSFTIRLAILLVVAKAAGDLLLRSGTRSARMTVYYQDYLVDWFRFGVLAAVGLVLHAAASRVLGVEPPPGPVALGIFVISRVTFRHG